MFSMRDIMSAPAPADDDEYLPEDEDEESLLERVAALTEMFPEGLRNGASKLTDTLGKVTKKSYSWARTGAWILFSTTIIAVAPVMLEAERFQMEEMQKMQQRQMLLGPNVARG